MCVPFFLKYSWNQIALNETNSLTFLEAIEKTDKQLYNCSVTK